MSAAAASHSRVSKRHRKLLRALEDFDLDARAVEVDAAWRQHQRETVGDRRVAMDDMERRHRLDRLFPRFQEAQNHRCCHCGVRFDEADPRLRPTWEHVLPRNLGGLDAPENLAVACQLCNSTRGDDPAWRPGGLRWTPEDWEGV